MLFSVMNVFAQQGAVIKGKITNTKKEPLVGATIVVSPSGKTFVSGDDGSFVLNGLAAEKNTIVRASYTGYAAEEKAIDLSSGGVQELNFVLKNDVLALTDVVVVGNTGSRNKLNSSVSVSTLKQDDIQKSAPRTTAEIFRSIPGIKAEASGGDGNTNITVRGVR